MLARSRSALARVLRGVAVTLALSTTPAFAQAPSLSAAQAQLRAIYQELVEINTTDSVGDATQAARAMAAHSRLPARCRYPVISASVRPARRDIEREQS